MSYSSQWLHERASVCYQSFSAKKQDQAWTRRGPFACVGGSDDITEALQRLRRVHIS